MRRAVRDTKLQETYNRIFHNDNGILDKRLKSGSRKINKTGTKRYKTIRVTDDTHFTLTKIASCGKSMNDVIVDLIEFYDGEKQ